jgi:glycine/D-amino acid oxidase-like deaminating enzyme
MNDPSCHADIAVIGAGIIGCLVAREIADRTSNTSIVMIDGDGAGSGASRRSAGLHVPRGRTAAVRTMSAYSEEYYDKLARGSTQLPIASLDMTVVAPVAMADRVLETYLDSAAPTPTGPPWSQVRIPEDYGVWRVRGAQCADVYGLVQALARDLRPRASLLEGVRVTGIEPGSDTVLLRLSTGAELRVGQVVVAPGPWVSDQPWSDLLGPDEFRVKRVVALHVEKPVTPQDPAIMFEREDAFLLPMPHRGHWLFSYTCQEWDVDPETSEALAGRHFDQAREILGQYAAELVQHCASGRVFCDTYSPNREPVVRSLTDDGKVVFAGAANGSGYRLAPAIASAAVGLLHL